MQALQRYRTMCGESGARSSALDEEIGISILSYTSKLPKLYIKELSTLETPRFFLPADIEARPLEKMEQIVIL